MNPRNIASSGSTRREFLQQTVGFAASATVLSEIPPNAHAAAAADSRLPTIRLGPHDITRQQLSDQVSENASIVREICSRAAKL